MKRESNKMNPRISLLAILLITLSSSWAQQPSRFPIKPGSVWRINYEYSSSDYFCSHLTGDEEYKYFIDGDMIEAWIQNRWDTMKHRGMDYFLKELGSPTKIKKDIKIKLWADGTNWFDTMQTEGEIVYDEQATEVAKKLFPQFYK